MISNSYYYYILTQEEYIHMSKHLFTDIRVPIEPDNPSVMRHEELCIKCGQCKTVCTESIGVAAITIC